MSIVRLLSVVLVLSMVQARAAAQEFTVVVMDPLALELSCPCVKGYAQRDYAKLCKHLEKQLGREIKLRFTTSLKVVLDKGSGADLIIGKDSIVRHEAKTNKLDFTPIASLTGKDGKTTQTGLFVVAAADPALTVGDLKGYQILFGPDNADEKHTAALRLLRDLEVKAPAKLDTCNSCSDGALKILDLHKNGTKAAAVISSYAQPLLEGCGTIKKGDIRVVGETDPVPFVLAFINDNVRAEQRTAVQQALFAVGKIADLCTALETKNGFVKIEPAKKK